MIEIVKMKPEHIDFVAKIEELCIDTPWGKEQIKKELENKKATYFCAVANENVVGYIGVWNIMDEGNITNIAVHPGFQRKGIGYALLEEMKKFAKEEKMLFLTLEVNEKNEKAILLYKKCGFEITGRRKKYYHNNDDAILMNYNIDLNQKKGKNEKWQKSWQ